MQALFKSLVFLLLAAVITAPLPAQGFPPLGAAHERPAGCHDDGGSDPAPGPASHNCCQVGHHFAIVPQSSASRSALHGSLRVESLERAIVVARLNSFPNLLTASGDPPITSPLRV
jgi:hypothetical protein